MHYVPFSLCCFSFLSYLNVVDQNTPYVISFDASIDFLSERFIRKTKRSYTEYETFTQIKTKLLNYRGFS